MGFLLLWTEDLTLWLVVAALTLALASRAQWRLIRWGILLIGIGLPAAAIMAVALLFGALEGQPNLQIGLSLPLLMLLLSLLVGETALLIWGLRRRGEDPPRALHWSPGMLSLLAAGAFLAHLVTFSTLDLAVRQQMDVLRAEARVQAQQVSHEHLGAEPYTAAVSSIQNLRAGTHGHRRRPDFVTIGKGKAAEMGRFGRPSQRIINRPLGTEAAKCAVEHCRRIGVTGRHPWNKRS